MKMLGLKYVTPKDYSEYFDMNTGMFEIRNYISLDLSLLKYKNEWSPSTNIDQENLPSSIILDEKIIKKGIPTLSIVIDNVDLYDQATGIFRNSLKKGRNWERPCFVSYYNKGDLLFATGAGVRVHGGASRKHNIRSLVFSLRLYFRNIYRLNKFRNGILFDSGSDPLRHLVVRKDGGGGYHFLNHMAYEISNHIGCITPQTEPVRVFLNGSRYGHGNYVLTEHLSREYLVSHYGHDNFVLVRTAKRIRTDKAKKARANEYLKILKWAKNKDIKMTMKEVEKYISIDNFTKWWISVLFLANSDPYQGLALLDKNKTNSKWFWIKFDMDHCIRKLRGPKIKNIWEQDISINELINKNIYHLKTDPRPILFKRMNIEDPEYRKYFQRMIMDILNHRLTPEYLESRVLYYEKTAKSFGIKKLGFISETREFFKHRHEFLMKLLKKYLDYPDSFYCKVRNIGDADLKIDGYIHKQGYKGLYFKSSKITVEIVGDKGKEISYWLVNGEKVKNNSNKLTYSINSNTIIDAVLFK